MQHRLPRQLPLAVLLTFLVVPVVLAQSPYSAHTLQLDDGSRPPAATVADVAWIAGHWRGEALGGVSEEVWSPPFGGAMMGMYKLVKDDAPAFYELLTIVEDAGSLVLRLKHFAPDLKGWEEKDESVEFRLVKLEPGNAYFAGLTFLRREDGITVYVASRRKDGSVDELEFVYRRFDPT